MDAIYNQTVLHPAALCCTLLAGVFIFTLPWRRVLIPMVVVSMLIPVQQQIVVFSFDFSMMRLMVLFGLLRVVLRRDAPPIRVDLFDVLFLAYLTANALAYIALRQTMGAVINRMGLVFTALGIYLIARLSVADLHVINRLVQVLLCLVLTLCAVMAVEYTTGRNLFAVFGGVPAHTAVRAGMLRCQGPFGNSIMAGTYAATLVPLFLARRHQGRAAYAAGLAGAAAAAIIAWLSNSSGAVLTLAAGIGALCLWPVRRWVRLLRWGVVLGVGLLHIVMTGPVWSLFMKVKVFSASSGYHRYKLIDEFVGRFGEWAAAGTDTLGEWGPHWMNLRDVTNQYVFEGVNGGILGLLLFALLLGLAFSGVGQAVRVAPDSRRAGLLVWGVGASLFAHCVAFMGSTYFGQITLIWYMQLAWIASIRTMTAETIAAAAGTGERATAPFPPPPLQPLRPAEDLL